MSEQNHSNIAKLSWHGHPYEVYYNEASASAFAWHCFSYGIGETIGASRAEACDEMCKKIDKTLREHFPNQIPT